MGRRPPGHDIGKLRDEAEPHDDAQYVEASVAIMGRMKAALDPDGILDPGKMLPD